MARSAQAIGIRRVLVTGASAGIGRACADRLHEAGWQVVGASRRAAAGGWQSVSIDVDDDQSVAEGMAQVLAGGRLDVGVTRGHVVVAVTVLRERLAEPWTLEALATEVHLSSSQLLRSFDATVDMPPMSYLRQMRVEACDAARLHGLVDWGGCADGGLG